MKKIKFFSGQKIPLTKSWLGKKMTLSLLLSTPNVIVHQVNVTVGWSTFTYRQCCFVLCNTIYRWSSWEVCLSVWDSIFCSMTADYHLYKKTTFLSVNISTHRLISWNLYCTKKFLLKKCLLAVPCHHNISMWLRYYSTPKLAVGRFFCRPHTGLEAMWSLKKILKPIIYMAV